MKTELSRYFKRFLECGASCTPSGRAVCALRDARTLIEWKRAESADLVRIVAEPEQERFSDVFGDEIYKREADYIERWGCWLVSSQVNHGNEAQGSDWQHCDSIGMCVYANPTDPFENCYVIDLMRSALEQIPQPGNVDELCTSTTT